MFLLMEKFAGQSKSSQKRKRIVHSSLLRLSGYENTLLGYRSRHYRLVKVHPDAMDIIMFGEWNITSLLSMAKILK